MHKLQSSSTMYVIIILMISTFKNCFASEGPAIFIFGDSVYDAGNNNYFPTIKKADHRPFGIDFGRPTGRFTNEKTMIDILGQYLGVQELIPPYLDPRTRGEEVLRGVNYASGGSGILRYIIDLYYKCISLDEQIDNFEKTRETIISLKGSYRAQKRLNTNSLFVIASGSNDLLINDLQPEHIPPRHQIIDSDTYATQLITKLKSQLKRLYEMDARKFIVSSVPPLGFAPSMVRANPYAVNRYANTIADKFNRKLINMLSELRNELRGAVFVYANTYHISADIFQNFKTYGFESVDQPCCEGVVCDHQSRICPFRKKYAFWDSNHPTTATYAIIAERILNGKVPDVHPLNVRQLLDAQTY